MLDSSSDDWLIIKKGLFDLSHLGYEIVLVREMSMNLRETLLPTYPFYQNNSRA